MALQECLSRVEVVFILTQIKLFWQVPVTDKQCGSGILVLAQSLLILCIGVSVSKVGVNKSVKYCDDDLRKAEKRSIVNVVQVFSSHGDVKGCK